MTVKRFNYHIDEVGIYYYVCDTFKKGDDQIILEFDTKYDAMEVCELLNELHEDNQKKDKVITHLMRIIYSHEPHTFAKAVEKNVKEMLE